MPAWFRVMAALILPVVLSGCGCGCSSTPSPHSVIASVAPGVNGHVEVPVFGHEKSPPRMAV